MNSTIERSAIEETLSRLLFAVDRRNFELAEQQLAEEVELDYTSLFGGSVQKLRSGAVIDQWKGVLPLLKTTQHMLSNVMVDVKDGSARCTSYVQALHYLPYAEGGNTWTLYGYYDHELIKQGDCWKITSMKLTATHQEGNTSLMSIAASVPKIRGVAFQSEGDTLVGKLFLPATYKEGYKLPAVIITGSWTTVKEQMPTLYASLLARRGFAAFVFDFRGFGESGGEPRQYESYTRKIADIRNAIACLTTLPEVNAAQVAGVGICASAGYMAHAVAGESQLRSLTLIAPWMHNRELVELIYGGKEGVQRRLADAQQAYDTWMKTGVATIVPACSATDDRAAMYGNWDYYLNPSRGAIPEWKNEFNMMSWSEWLNFDAIKAAPSIHVPVLMIHSENAAIPGGAKLFYDGLSVSKQLVWTEGTQFDFYDSEKQVLFAAGETAKWLIKTL